MLDGVDPDAFLSDVLTGWRRAQLAQNFSADTVRRRVASVMRMGDFAGSYPWQWTAADADDFFGHPSKIARCTPAGLRQRDDTSIRGPSSLDSTPGCWPTRSTCSTGAALRNLYGRSKTEAGSRLVAARCVVCSRVVCGSLDGPDPSHHHAIDVQWQQHLPCRTEPNSGGIAKKRLAKRLNSGATSGEGSQNLLCAYLAASVLAGLLAQHAVGLVVAPYDKFQGPERA